MGGGRFWLGRLGGELADDVVATVKRTEPVPWVEVHGHGGREVVRFLIELFREQGLQLCSWEDFLRKTSEDHLSTAAAIALAQAATLRTAGILLDQQQGALRRALEAIQQALARGETATAAEGLSQLARYAAVGQHLTRPWRVVIAGAPNVGKSSLVNALAGYQRSIVAATPGTTRDVVTTRIALDGWLIELADTAGQHEEAEALEAQGIRRAQATAAAADLCLWLLDGSTPPHPNPPPPGGRETTTPSPPVGEGWGGGGAGVLYVINKCDLPPAWDHASAPDALRVSALTGAGLAELCAAIVARLVPDPPPSGAAVPFTPQMCAGIAEAKRVLDAGDVVHALRIVAWLREDERT